MERLQVGSVPSTAVLGNDPVPIENLLQLLGLLLDLRLRLAPRAGLEVRFFLRRFLRAPRLLCAFGVRFPPLLSTRYLVRFDGFDFHLYLSSVKINLFHLTMEKETGSDRVPAACEKLGK